MRKDRAVEAWENAVKYNPALTFCYWNLASLYEERGDRDLALKHLQTYARLTTGAERRQALDRIDKLKKNP